MKMKKFLSLVILTAYLTLLCIPCFAEANLKNVSLIDIEDGIFTSDEINNIRTLAQNAAAENGASIGIIFTNSSLSKNQLMARADRLYDDNCDPESDAIILAVDISSRKYYIRQIGKMNHLYSSSMDAIEEAALEGLRKSDWYIAATGFIGSIAEYAEYHEPDPSYSEDGTELSMLTKEVIVICVGIAIGLIVTGIMSACMNNAKPGHNATSYAKKDSFNLDERTDVYLYSTVTKTKIETESSSSRGGSYGGGSSRGGRGGSF